MKILLDLSIHPTEIYESLVENIIGMHKNPEEYFDPKENAKRYFKKYSNEIEKSEITLIETLIKTSIEPNLLKTQRTSKINE